MEHNQDYQERIREILKPIQAEYDGDTPMLPGTIPEIIQALIELLTEAKIEELQYVWDLGFERYKAELSRGITQSQMVSETLYKRLAELKQTGEKP